MEFELSHEHRRQIRTVTVVAEPSIESVERAVTRLMAWAEQHGVIVRGRPFARVHGRLSLAVHLPVELPAEPQLDSGIVLGGSAPGLIVQVDGVPFGGLQRIADMLICELGAESQMAGPPEFHAGTGGWEHGSVALPVVSLPTARARPLAVMMAKLRPSLVR
ncbi:MAG TPA: hypothetical protein VIH05_02960 [Tepidiformaceae bacterium]